MFQVEWLSGSKQYKFDDLTTVINPTLHLCDQTTPSLHVADTLLFSERDPLIKL